MVNNQSFKKQILTPLLSNIEGLPYRNAFCINDNFYTYKQLGEYISQIRHEIRKLFTEEIYIGLITNDDLETYASIFALWLEGKAYVPLHPGHPRERSIDILEQLNIKTILDSSLTTKFSNYTIIKSSSLSFVTDFLDYDKNIDDSADAYVLFTSGSTGSPKGVRISRKNLSAFMDSFWNCGIEITKEDRCLQCFDLTFDVSVQSFMVPLIKGACVFTLPNDQIKYSYAYGLLEDQHITFGAMAPSMIRYLKPYFDEISIPELKYCILTGEASPLDLVEQWKKCIPNAQIFNFYGPTETTIYCTYYKLQPGNNKELNGMLSIGKPMKNVEAIIVDENKNILGKGVKGELCISGDHVSVGYWNQPEKNQLSFFEKSVQGTTHRIYRTGDLCFYDDEGYLMLYGRLDSQTKIQGYRVELGEIEFHARVFLKGNNTVAIVFNNSIGNNEVALFIENNTIDTDSLLDYLKSRLPFYMIPTRIIIENEFPLNMNGKIDKKILKQKL